MKQFVSLGAVWPFWTLGVVTLSLLGCGGETNSGSNNSDPQTPPTGRANIEQWLAQGFYTSWHCETAPHAARPPSPHSQNRICSNDLLSRAGPGEYPVGAASVKELYSGSTVTGYSLSRHTSAGTTGNTWYWYERVGSSGPGADGNGVGVCVGCHQGAGSDAAHSGHDFVYTQVR